MKKYFVFLFIFFALFSIADFTYASTEVGTITDGFQYAWGDSSGWFNFDTWQGAIFIRDTYLTGYVWSENFGWINLNPPGSGVKNNNEGILSGYAWGENTGWINFSGVIINSEGRFLGLATGDVVGTISFNCDKCLVKTDWRPASTRGGGGLPPEAYSPPGSGGGGGGYIYPFSVLINNGDEYTKNLTATLTLNSSSDVETMAISESPSFENAVQEDFKKNKTIVLSPGDGEKTIFVKFYTHYGQVSETISDSIILKTKLPEVKITYIKEKYGKDEEVILSGEGESNEEIFLYLDDLYSSFKVDANGQWLISLGKLSLGKHKIELVPKDVAGESGKPLSTEVLVEGDVFEDPEQLNFWSSILEKMKKGLNMLIPKFLKPEETKPSDVIVIPQKAPLSFNHMWNLLPVEAIKRFVLSPLPRDIRMLAQKFPKLEKTLESVGIEKITDVEKLRNVSLKLPGLFQSLGSAPVEIRPGEFIPAKGVPIGELSIEAKQKIPTEIVFATTGGGLVDFNIALSVNDQGRTEQTIKTISGKPLQLVVKPDNPVKNVKGYIIFKSRNSTPAYQVPLNYLQAALMFDGPDLAEEQEEPVNIEEKLVLLEFEYEDIGHGIYTATVQSPAVDGQYEIITVMDYLDETITSKEIRLITAVDPEGYVYEKNGIKETRILGAVASLYWLNPETSQYELWPAKDYQQENPQTTDVSGTYSFLVPEGYYHLKVDAPGYLSYDGKPFQVTEGSGVHINVELKTIYWWTRIIDWKIVLLIMAVLLLFYNFYRDKMKERNLAQNKI